VVSLAHLHSPTVSVREQAGVLVHRLRRSGAASFRSLVAGETTVVVVARFLAILELFREGVVHLDQADPLGELTVRWTGTSDGDIEVHDDYDEPGADPIPEEHA
jgi:segregation and condensation protein A